MKWNNSRRSTNVEDRRGQTTGRSTSGGGGGFSPMAMGGGLGSIIIMIVLYFIMNGLGGSFGTGNSNITNTPPSNNQPSAPASDEMGQFISTVLAYTEDVWKEQFKLQGRTYQNPTLVLFDDAVQSGCGYQSAQVGPFYCPTDRKIYIDLGFFNELETKYKAGGDFAIAYVLAHEVGHHVQNLLGITDEMNKIRTQVSQTAYNRYSVALELQADYLAGVWAHHVKGFGVLEQGDLEEALNAANAIGDDTIQKRAQGYTVPDSFTHGTSEQRKFWLYRGFEFGDFKHGDTFSDIVGN